MAKIMKRDVIVNALSGDGKNAYQLAEYYYRLDQADEAFYWAARSAKAREPRAYLLLAEMYRFGIGTPMNISKAHKWYKKAIRAGSRDAIDYLADDLMLGYGVRKNPAKALRLYRRSARMGSGYAEYKLGICLTVGLGVKKNKEFARVHLSIACSRGVEQARWQLDCLHLA